MNTHMPQTLQEAANIVQTYPAVEESIPNTGLRLFHVWKEQILSLSRSEGFELNKRIDCLVADTYGPFLSLWSWLMPQEEYLRQWAEEGIPQICDMKNPGVQLAFRAHFFELFTEATARFMRVVEYTPKGDWYLVFATGGDLGGSGGSMYANLLNLGDIEPHINS